MSRPEEPQYAEASALAGLATEVEKVRLAVAGLAALPGRVDELAGLVARLAETTARSSRPAPPEVPVWLGLPPDRHQAVGTDQAEQDAVLELTGLTVWLGRVYLRYADAARTLPACWLWHPEVIEELLWLRAAWHAAHAGDTASITAVGDWHDRQRPGVVRRIKDYAGLCSLENHQPSQPAPVVPLRSAAGPIARWWTTHREASAPEPTAEQLAEAAAMPRRRQERRRP